MNIPNTNFPKDLLKGIRFFAGIIDLDCVIGRDAAAIP